MNTVSVVIVTHNHADCVGQCLESVLASEHPCGLTVVLVDNCSRDHTLEIVRQYNLAQLFVRDRRHPLSSNLNLALSAVNTTYTLILNPDIVLPPSAIRGLQNFMDQYSDAGACGPKLLHPDGSLQLSCRRFPTPWTFIVRRTPLRVLWPAEMRGKEHLMADCDHEEVQMVDWVLGACTMFRTQSLRQAGLFDERFPLYCEDIDVCHRLWQHGWAVYYDPRVSAVHNHQARSDKRFFSRYALWHFHSMALYVLKHRRRGFRRPRFRPSESLPVRPSS